MGVFALSEKRSTFGLPGLSLLNTSWFWELMSITRLPMCLNAIFFSVSVFTSSAADLWSCAGTG